MGSSPREILITTTHKASEEARSLSRVLEHVIPYSTYVSRGSKNNDEIIRSAIETNVEFVFICHSKGNRVTEIKFYTVEKDQLKSLDYFMKIYEFIDYKIFGWSTMPEIGPLSVSREVRNSNPEMIDILENCGFDWSVSGCRCRCGCYHNLNAIIDYDKHLQNKIEKLRKQIKKCCV